MKSLLGSRLMRFVVGLIAVVCLCLLSGDSGVLSTAIGMGIVGMAIDPSIVAQLDQGTGVQIQDMVAGARFLTEINRGSLMQDGRSVGASIASNLLQANIPEQGMNLKFADVTPRSPGQAQAATPPAA